MDNLVTDPDLLAKLNAPDEEPGLVTDPDLLAKLNAPDEEPSKEAIPTGRRTPQRVNGYKPEPKLAVDRSKQFSPTGEPAIDRSSGLGDLEAGVETLKQVEPALAIAGAAGDIQTARRKQKVAAADEKEISGIDARLAEIEKLPDADWQAAGDERAKLMARKAQLEMLHPQDGGLEKDRAEADATIPRATQSIVKNIAQINELNKLISDIPVNPAAARFNNPQGEGFFAKTGSMWDALADDPYGVMRTTVLRSLPSSAPTIIASVVGGLAGPEGAAGMAALAGGSIEMGTSIAQYVSEDLAAKGIDPSNAAEVQKYALEHTDEILTMVGKARARAVVIGGASAVSGGLSEKIAESVVTKPFLTKAGGIAAGTAVEGVTEGVGEAGAELAAGDQLDPTQIFGEVAGSVGSGSITTAGQIAREGAFGPRAGTKPKVNTTPNEKAPDEAQTAALNEANKSTTSASSPVATPATTTATATVTPEVTPAAPKEPQHSGVHVGETAPDVAAAAAAANNNTTPSGPQRPVKGTGPGAAGEFLKQMAAFRAAERAQREAEQQAQAQPAPSTVAPPAPSGTAQAPEGPQVGGAPAAPPNQTQEAVQPVEPTMAPDVPPAEMPVSEAPSPTAAAPEALPPVVETTPTQTTAPGEAGGSAPVTSEVTAPKEPERKWQTVAQRDLLLDSGMTEQAVAGMKDKRRRALASEIRAKAERDNGGLKLERMTPEERGAALTKAWTELQDHRAKAEEEASKAAASKPPKAVAAVKKSKSKEAEAAPTPEQQAMLREAERKKRVDEGLERIRKQREEEAAAQAAQPKEEGKPRILKPVDEESLRKEAEAAVAKEDSEAKMVAEKNAADARIAKVEAQTPEASTNNLSSAERVRRASNKETANNIVDAPEHSSRPSDADIEMGGKRGVTAREAVIARAKQMVEAAHKLMTPDEKGRSLPDKLHMSKDEEIAPNAAQMLLHEARKLASKNEPSKQDVVNFRANEVFLRAGYIEEYLKHNKVEGDVQNTAKPTALNKDGEPIDAVESAPDKGSLNPEEALAAKQDAVQEAEEPDTAGPTPEAAPAEKPKFTSESNPGYTTPNAAKPVKVETKKKRSLAGVAEKAASEAPNVTKAEEAKATSQAKSGKLKLPKSAIKSAAPKGWGGVNTDGRAKPIRRNFGNSKFIARLRKLLYDIDANENLAKFATDFGTFKEMTERLTKEHFDDATLFNGHFEGNGSLREAEIGQTILDKLNDVIADVPVYVIQDSIMDTVDPKVGADLGAFYDTVGDYIVLRESAFNSPNKFIWDLTHEGAHAALWAAVRSNHVARRQLAQIAALLKSDTRANNETDVYGQTNVDEFLAELLSNPDFKAKLMDLRVAPEFFEKIGLPVPKGKASNAWEAVKRWAAKVMGYTNRDDDLYSMSLNIVDKLLSQAPRAREDYLKNDYAGKKEWGKRHEQSYREYASKLPDDENTPFISTYREEYEDLSRDWMFANKKGKTKDEHYSKLLKTGLLPATASSVSKLIKANFPDGISEQDFAAIAQTYLDEQAAAKPQKPKNYWNALIAGGIPYKTAVELNNVIKAELGKSIDPATVDVVVQDMIDEYGGDKVTSEGNSGGTVPPYNPPDTPGMGPGDPPQRMAGKFKGTYEGKIPLKMRRFFLKAMTLDWMRQKYERFFQNGKENPLKKWVEAIRSRETIADDFALPIEKLGAEFQKLAPKEQVEFVDLALEATTLNVSLGGETNEHLGKNAAKGLQGKSKLDALNNRFSKMSPEAQDLYKRLTKQFRESHNDTTKGLVYNILSELRRQQEEAHADKKVNGPPPTITTGNAMQIMDRVVNGKLTAEDEALINDKTLFNALKRATSLRLIQGDYFPLHRFGDYVITTREAVDNPGWTTISGKAGKKKVTTIPVKTEVIDSNYDEVEGAVPDTLRVTFNPDVRGNKVAVMRHLRDYAKNHEFTLQGISTKYRDRQTGKIVSKGDQMVDREYDMVYEAKFQTEGVHYFDSESEAREFLDTSDSHFTSGIMDRRKVREHGHISGGELGAIVGMIEAGKNKDDKRSDEGANAAYRQQMRNLLENAIISQMAGNRAQKHFLKRRNVRGASRDMLRGIFTYARAMGNHYATLSTAPDMRNAVREMQDVASARYTNRAGLMSEFMNEVYRREEAIMTPNKQSVVTRDILTLSYFDKLISLGFSINNGMQPVNTTLPILAGRFGVARSIKAMGESYSLMGFGDTLLQGMMNTGRALKDIRKSVLNTSDLVGDARKKLGKEYEALIDEVVRLGDVSSDSGLEIGGVIEQGRGKWGRGLHKVDRAARQLPNAIETVNRIMTAVSAYRLFIEDGMGKKEAIDQAVTTVTNTQGDYRGSNTPNWMKVPYVGWTFQFKKFGLVHACLMGDMVDRALGDASQAERVIARKQLAYYFATSGILAGAVGLPIGIEIVKTGFILAGMFLGGDGWDEEEYKLRKMVDGAVGKTLGHAVMDGPLSTLTGIDFASKLSLSSLIVGREPYTYDPANISAFLLNFISGAPGSLLQDWMNSGRDLYNADTADSRIKALSKLIPVKTLSDMADAYRNYESGDVSAVGAVANAAGFKTLEQSDDARQGRHDRRMKEKAKTEVKSLINEMYSALDRNDTSDENTIMRKIHEHNRVARKEKRRGDIINPAGVRRSWRRKQRENK